MSAEAAISPSSEIGEASCDFFIVGAPKCGTTALHRYLGSHPRIFMSPAKEPTFFGSDLTRLDRRRYTPESYRALFAGAGPGQLRGEASVYSLLSRRAAVEIHADNPHARIIILLRDPIEVLHAYHGQRLAVGSEDITDLETAIEAWPDRRCHRRLPWNGRDILDGLDYCNVVDFAPQVERFAACFPPEQIHVILQPDLRAATLSELDRCLDFLGLDLHLDEIPPSVNPSRVLRRPRLNRITRSDAAEWLGEKLPSGLVGPIGRKLRGAAVSLAPRPPIDPDLERRLLEHLAPGVEALEEVLGRTLPWRDRYRTGPRQNRGSSTRLGPCPTSKPCSTTSPTAWPPSR